MTPDDFRKLSPHEQAVVLQSAREGLGEGDETVTQDPVDAEATPRQSKPKAHQSLDGGIVMALGVITMLASFFIPAHVGSGYAGLDSVFNLEAGLLKLMIFLVGCTFTVSGAVLAAARDLEEALKPKLADET